MAETGHVVSSCHVAGNYHGWLLSTGIPQDGKVMTRAKKAMMRLIISMDHWAYLCLINSLVIPQCHCRSAVESHKRNWLIQEVSSDQILGRRSLRMGVASLETLTLISDRYYLCSTRNKI